MFKKGLKTMGGFVCLMHYNFGVSELGVLLGEI